MIVSTGGKKSVREPASLRTLYNELWKMKWKENVPYIFNVLPLEYHIQWFTISEPRCLKDYQKKKDRHFTVLIIFV